MRTLEIEEDISRLNEIAVKQCNDATTIEEVLELDELYFGENGILRKMALTYADDVLSKLTKLNASIVKYQQIAEDCIKDCQTAQTPNELTLVKAKYLGKNGIITLINKEQSEYYKQQKGAKE